MKQQNIIILGIVSWIFIVFALFSLVIAYESKNNISVQASTSITEQKIINDCSNKTLFETADCLNQKISPIFNYTIRSDNDRTFDDILVNGGDCYDYANLYLSLAEKLGFKGNTNVLVSDNKDEVAHTRAEIWDKDKIRGYCILDQTYVWCMHLGDAKDYEK